MERFADRLARSHLLEWETSVTEADSPRRGRACPAKSPGQENERNTGPSSHWRTIFLEKLAETSNVSASAAEAGITPSRAYKARRDEAKFAEAWFAAVIEGYEHLEMETLHRLRMGTDKDEPKFDIANALRILAMHRETVARERARVEPRDEEAILASIDAKIERMRSRERNATRLLADEGIRGPHLLGKDA